MAFHGNTTLQSLFKKEKHTVGSPSHSLHVYPLMPEPDPQFSPAKFYSASTVIPISPQSPGSSWALSPNHPSAPSTPIHPQPSSPPTLVYQCIASLCRHEGSIFSVAVLQDNVFTGSESSRIRVWKQPDFVERGYLKTTSGDVRAILAYANMLFTAHKDNKIRVWSVTSNSEQFLIKKLTWLPRRSPFWFFSRRKTRKHQDCISCLAYYHAEGLLYTGSRDKMVKTWRVSDHKCMDSFIAHNEAINGIVVNQHDGFVFTCSSDGSVKIWRRVCGEISHTLTMTLKFQLSPVNALALSSSFDYCYLYSAYSDGCINFWSKEKVSGRFNHGGFLQGHQYSVLCLVAIGNLVVSGSEDTTIRVWRRDEETSFHQCLAVLNGNKGPIRCLDACEETVLGFLVFSASMDGTLKVWRVKVYPEEKKTSEETSKCSTSKCDSTLKIMEYETANCYLNTRSMEYAMHPVLSPSWVEKKLQGLSSI